MTTNHGEIQSDPSRRVVSGTDTRVGAGAQLSITAPANSIRVVRHGIDSLYVSFRGKLDPQTAIALQSLKLLAQDGLENNISQAVFRVGDHLFTVLPRGRGRFAFVLEDNWFSIQISNACALPLAHVQIRSEYLTAVGAEEALRSLTSIVELFGEVLGPATVSRIDLHADFVGDNDLTMQPGFAWVKRCRKRDIHEDRDRITGISFGAGNELSARLYDKTLEITKSGKNYLKPLWATKGWTEGQTVWRMEFQARREAFPDALKGPCVDALPHIAAWWQYLATEWLRLAIPSDSDETRTRWPTHPVWEVVAGAWEAPLEAPLMTRITKARPPSDDSLFKAGWWGLSSYMAREGIADLGEGMGEFLEALRRYHNELLTPEGLQGYIDRKVRLKARRYNTSVNRHDKE